MLATDTILGPYRIVAPIGAGGMGEVYRAVDIRLGREVAVKVLSPTLSADTEALHRFEQEARAVGMLNHPNIVAIYDVGEQDGLRFIVSELLEGESLRVRLRQGAIPPRKTTDYGVQIARGLAAAHEKGIIHRDLKPENIFLTRDGQVKILDFGLVKLLGSRIPGGDPNVDDHAPTLPTTPTEPGRILGTVGYMAPEQVRGASGDQRSDIFAFGVILYEMLAGVPPFRGDSPVETLNAILKDEPPELMDLDTRIPPALDRVVHHCLEKNPDERFQSARDLAFGLGSMSGLTSQAISFRPGSRLRLRRLLRPALIALAVVAALTAVYYAGRQRGLRPPAAFKRVTFRSGTIVSARFTPDGDSILYSARWSGGPLRLYSGRADAPESRDLGLGNAELLDVSSTGQLAIALDARPIGYLRDSGTLAQVSISGGTPRPLVEEVEAAAWSPDGKNLAIVRSIGGHCRLEYPIGTVVYETAGWISAPRFDRAGGSIAILDHPFLNDDRGSVAVIDVREKKRRTLTSQFNSVQGLAWSPDGKELWFGADQSGSPHGRSILATNLKGRLRVQTTSAGWLWLQDVTADGRMLVSQQTVRAGIAALPDGSSKERDLSWVDFSVVRDLSNDGRTILFSESGEAGGASFGIYIRNTDGSPPIRLGDGTSEALSPDGRWVLSIPRDKTPPQVMMLPTGAGQPRQITRDGISHRNARWFPDGRRILFQGNLPGAPPRLWVQVIGAATPKAISPENVSGTLVTPDGKRVLGRDGKRRFWFYDADAVHPPIAVPVLHSGDVPIRFSSDGRAVFVASFGRIPATLTKVDLDSGERMLWCEVMPADGAGLINVGPVWPTPDGRTLVYSYTRLLSDLYIVQ